MHHAAVSAPRHDWTVGEVKDLFAMPFNDLLFLAATVHRRHFDANKVQLSRLLSIKTGSCPEDCKYCPQSAHYDTGLEKEQLMEVQTVLTAAAKAKAEGATRFCMGAAWRNPTERDLPKVLSMVAGVKALGLESCATLGMLTPDQAQSLAEAGLDYYNHNIDTSEEHYKEIITTRTFQDRLDTLANVRQAGMKVCCGGIVGMGESGDDRAAMLTTLATMEVHPESVPVNLLIRVPGTPMEGLADTDPLDFVRTVAVARILMPKSHVRIAAGRQSMTDELQAMCFFAGCNSIFCGDVLLTAGNAAPSRDQSLFDRLGLTPETL
jgi:biotin synthase